MPFSVRFSVSLAVTAVLALSFATRVQAQSTAAPTAGNGTYIASDPLAGVRYDNRYDVSLGMAYRHIKAGPNVLQGANLGYTVHNVTSNQPVGTVLSQNPLGGTKTLETHKVVLTVSGTQTYGSPPMFAYSAAGLVGKDTTTVITGTLTCSTTPATSSSSPVGTYAIASCSGLTVPSYYTAIASDYKLGSLIIGTAPLTVTASSATVSYGQAPPQITASYNGFVPGDSSSSLTARPTCSTTATQTSPPGTYPTTCTGAVDVNYSPINYVKGTVTVTPSTMLVLGPGTGTLTMSGQATANVRGNLAVSSPSTGSINLSGQASLKAAGTLISPAAKPVVSSGQATTSVGSQETLPAEPDPYAGLAAPSTTGMTVYSSSTLQGPGVYTKAVTVSGQTKVTLASGTYVFDNGLTLSGQASVTSASGGVLLFFAGGELSISGQAAAVLLPLASGPYQAISLFQARTDTQAIILSGQDHTTSMVGALYAPVATLELSGQAVLAVGGLITDGVTLTGQAGVTVG